MAVKFFAGENHRRDILAFLWPRTEHPRPALNILDVLAAYSCQFALSLAVGCSLIYVSDSPNNYFAWSVLAGSALWAITPTVGAWLARRTGGPNGALGFWPPWNRQGIVPQQSVWRDIGLGLAAVPLCSSMTMLLNVCSRLVVKSPDQHPIVNFLRSQPGGWQLASIVVGAVLGAPFFEEIVFRGMLYNALRRSLGGIVAGILGALIFSTVHWLKVDFLSLFWLGLVLTWLYERTGSLVASMTLHFVNNAVSIIITLLLVNG
jgi:membrane protease YdiL (CAAX protease family)